LKITVLTLYPEMFPGVLGDSLLGRALDSNLWNLELVNIRDFASDKHKTVDDTPYGGGPGMVMKADVLGAALDYAISMNPNAIKLYTSPRGEVFKQQTAQEFCGKDMIILCGRFEGVDERVIQHYHLREISIGDYVLTGGEVAAQVIIEASVRLLAGVVGAAESLTEESFSNNLLEYPQYTKPQNWREMQIPPVLLSGNHAEIAKWRREQSISITKARRPDL